MSRNLIPEIAQIVHLPKEDRIRALSIPRWIGYPNGSRALERLEDLLNHPRIHRMPNLLFVGETNNGKTSILRRFDDKHHRDLDVRADYTPTPVFYMQAPPKPDERRFLACIMDGLMLPHRKHDRADNMLRQIMSFFRGMETRVLIIDEFQHLLAGPIRSQRILLNTIKYLGNELEISIVAAGTREAFNALQTDPQIANRFEPFVLPRWKIDRDFQALLASFESILPLRNDSKLSAPDLAIKIHGMSEGTIGEVGSLLSRAAKAAIQEGSEQITAETLDKLEWSRPSDRRMNASKAI